jgi:hypothetical protein
VAKITEIKAMSTLKVPLSQSQITAAGQIHRQLPGWNAADEALTLLAQRVPGFSLPETMLKVAAVNQLYGTNLLAVTRMARHISTALDRGSLEAGPILVEHIACIPAGDGQRAWRHFSFASKFCHFFIHPESCPIFDSYADDMLRLHLGGNRERDPKHPYLSFVNNSRALLTLANVTATGVELDRYLWIRGAYERWLKKREGPINVELKQFFVNAANRPQLAALVGNGT